MIGRLRQQLVTDGLAENTYFVFSSDNGLHMGEHRLKTGKMTAFDTDINVPLVIDGPGISPAPRSRRSPRTSTWRPRSKRSPA